MPSDAVTIAVALASPTAAGVVAVLIHRQRLTHERRLSDRAVVRDALARATAAAIDVEHAAVAWDTVYVAGIGEPRPHLVEAIDSAVAVWRSQAAMLAIVLPENHAVLRAADEVEGGVIELAHDIEDYHDRDGKADEVRTAMRHLREGLDSLKAAARQLAQATL